MYPNLSNKLQLFLFFYNEKESVPLKTFYILQISNFFSYLHINEAVFLALAY